jgi:murein DD-endopeptidase MepM/ murein hydrolase activator NlpD
LNRTAIRAAFFAGAAVIGWFTVNRDGPDAPRPGELLDESARAALSWRRPDTLGRGETLDKLLQRGGLDPSATREILAVAPMLDPRRLKAGMAVEFVGEESADVAHGVTIKLSVDHRLHVLRDSTGAWVATEERLPWVTDTVVVQGAVTSSLYQVMSSVAGTAFPGSSNTELTWYVAEVFEHRVDMSRELQPGDSIYALVERSRGPEDATKVGRVLAATLFVGGKPLEAIMFPDEDGRPKYYDPAGRSLATQFLQSPVQFRRISSTFGNRRHPILNRMRMHNGTDYAAATGTPVRAVGDGKVIRANFHSGYGNVIDVQHPNGYVSRYAHLSKFASGLKTGAHVTMGETIGFVGATGLATGPHLHFEVLVNGNPSNPTTVLRKTDGTPLPAKHTAAFARVRDEVTLAMGRPASGSAAPALARAE